MQFSAIVALFTAAAVNAIPFGAGLGSQGSCNVDSKVSCCDTTQALAGSTILGGSCTLNLPAAGDLCSTGSAYCCKTNQIGLLNTDSSCSPMSGLL